MIIIISGFIWCISGCCTGCYYEKQFSNLMTTRYPNLPPDKPRLLFAGLMGAIGGPISAPTAYAIWKHKNPT